MEQTDETQGTLCAVREGEESSRDSCPLHPQPTHRAPKPDPLQGARWRGETPISPLASMGPGRSMTQGRQKEVSLFWKQERLWLAIMGAYGGGTNFP